MEGIPTQNNVDKPEIEEVTVETNQNKEGQEKHIIDCDADPFVPEGWTVEEHQKGGQFEWNPANVGLYLSDTQEKKGIVPGNDLLDDIKSKPVMNACVLDFLNTHPELAPKEWDHKAVVFWGTTYRGLDGGLYARSFGYDGDEQSFRGYRWIGSNFSDRNPAAVLKG